MHDRSSGGMKALSLFSGIGGLDLAAESAGIQVVGQIEKDAFCQKVLAYHWPNVQRYGDIRNVHGTEFGTVDLLFGGFPCQPVSLAGKRRGRNDDRNLWPEFARLIGAIKPRWVVGENVYGLLSANVNPDRADSGLFGDVLRDLATLGYRVFWAVLRASDVGAPHRRERIAIVAYSDGANGCRKICNRDQLRQESHIAWSSEATGLANAISMQSQRQRGVGDVGSTSPIGTATEEDWYAANDSSAERLADASSGQCDRRERIQGQWGSVSQSSTGGDISRCSELADPDDERCQWDTRIGRESQWGTEYPGVGLADTYPARLQERNGSAGTSRACAEPDGRTGNQGQAICRLGGIADGIPSKLDQHPGWPARPGQEQFDYEPPRTVQGTQKNRTQRLKALGNAVVPQQLAPVFRAIVEIDGMMGGAA